MLELDGWERILDLACATGKRTLELCREGFDVIGIDVSSELLEVAGGEAEREPEPFQLRLYTIEELAGIFEQVGLRLADVFDEHGRPCAPSDVERELYVEARR
jgi:SAM-dependent methyltransferase